MKMFTIDECKLIKKRDFYVVTLTSYNRKNIISNIDLIKVDLEGHQYECLDNLFNVSLNLNINLMQLEYHRNYMYENFIPFNKIGSLL